MSAAAGSEPSGLDTRESEVFVDPHVGHESEERESDSMSDSDDDEAATDEPDTTN